MKENCLCSHSARHCVPVKFRPLDVELHIFVKMDSPNLLTLAEKVGFNVERFSKIASPNNSAG
jgi:hypothetical protein